MTATQTGLAQGPKQCRKAKSLPKQSFQTDPSLPLLNIVYTHSALSLHLRALSNNASILFGVSHCPFSADEGRRTSIITISDRDRPIPNPDTRILLSSTSSHFPIMRRVIRHDPTPVPPVDKIPRSSFSQKKHTQAGPLAGVTSKTQIEFPDSLQRDKTDVWYSRTRIKRL